MANGQVNGSTGLCCMNSSMMTITIWGHFMALSDQTATLSENARDALINLAVESWIFSRVFARVLAKLDAGEQNRYKSQYFLYVRKIEDALAQIELRIVNVEGYPFDPGVAATPLNIEEFNPSDKLIVDQMIEPVIIGRDCLARSGTVTLQLRCMTS